MTDRPDRAASGADAERRFVTVLFADAQESTALTERVGDEQAFRLVQRCVAVMADAVDRHGGTVTQFRGDGIMALFGAPIAHDDAATHAVTAALEMQAGLEALAVEAGARPVCRFRVGLNSGPVVVGRVGDDVLMEYTAIGDTANVAARMEQAAGPGEVLLAESTWRAARDFVECEPVGELDVKGKAAPVAAYRALRRTAARSRVDVAVALGRTSFVGREQELATLEGLAANVRGGHGRVAVVTGEPGIGKSRLLLELRTCLGTTVRWFDGQCSSVGGRIPWLPMTDLLRRMLAVSETDGPSEVARRIEQSTNGWSSAARASVPYLEWLLRCGGDEALTGLDPRERRAGALEAIRACVLDAAGDGPVVVAIEDMHWADAASHDAVAALADVVAGAPVLLILTCRPGHGEQLPGMTVHTRIALDQLEPGDADALASILLDAPDLPDDVRRLITEHAEGNPLFIEEVTASLMETGAVQPVDGTYRLRDDADRLAVPATVQEVILARIDRLPAEARDALQLAAVIGREFTRRLLDRIAALPEHLDASIRELQSLELIRPKSYFPELAFLFKHALTHDVAYSTLLDDRRRRLHRVVAEAIEELYADRLVEHYEVLARHWSEAGDDDKALDYLERSADNALDAFAVTDAVAYLERAIEVAARIGDTPRWASLCERRALVNMVSGRMADVLADMERLVESARERHEFDALAGALSMRSLAELMLHEFERSEATLGEAMAIGRHRAPRGFVAAGNQLRWLCAVLGRLDELPAIEGEVEPYLDQASEHTRHQWVRFDALRENWRAGWADAEATLAALEPHPDLTERLLGVWMQGLVRAGTGRYDEALAVLQSAREASERAGDLFARPRIINTVAWIHADLGDYDGAVALNHECLEFIAPMDLPNAEVEANARLNLADIAIALGRWDDAAAEVSWVERVVRQTKPAERWMLWRYSEHYFHVAGELQLARGDASGALRLADECLALAGRNDSRKNVVKGRRLRGQALLALGRGAHARTELDTAVALAREIGNPPQLWKSLAALAALHAAEGNEDAAAAWISEARDVVERVGAGLSDPRLRASLLRSPVLA